MVNFKQQFLDIFEKKMDFLVWDRKDQELTTSFGTYNVRYVSSNRDGIYLQVTPKGQWKGYHIDEKEFPKVKELHSHIWNKLNEDEETVFWYKALGELKDLKEYNL